MLGSSRPTAWRAPRAATPRRPAGLLRLPVAPTTPTRAYAATAADEGRWSSSDQSPHDNANNGRSRLVPARRVPIRQLPAAARLARDAARDEDRDREWQQQENSNRRRGGGGRGGGRGGRNQNQQPRNNTRVPAALSTSALAAAATRSPPDTQTLDAAEIVFVNMALRRAGEARNLLAARALASYALSPAHRPDRNEHTYAAAFLALASCGRLDLAVQAWRELALQGVDIGPVGASALIKAAGVAGDAAAGVALLDELLRKRVTLNTAVYNALVHLCGLAGRPDDALAAYNLSRLDPDPACRPNCFTYSALLGALVGAGRPEMGAELWRHITDDGAVKPDGVLWCQLIAAAGAAGDVQLARRLLDTMDGEARAGEVGVAGALLAAEEGDDEEDGEDFFSSPSSSSSPHPQQQHQQPNNSNNNNTQLPPPGDNSKAARAARRRYAAELSQGRAPAPAVNERHASALMAAFSRCGDLDGCERAYRRLLVARGLPVDAHAASILLTAAARAGAPRVTLSRVEALRGDLASRGAPLNAHVGTALIGAYRSAASGAEALAKQAAVAATAGGKKRGEDAPTTTTTPSSTAASTRREALRRALEVLELLRAERRANANAYTAAAAFCIQAGALGEAARLGRAMRREGVVLARPAIQSLARACLDAGLERPGVRMERLLENAEDEAYLEEEGLVLGGGGGGGGAFGSGVEAARAAALGGGPDSEDDDDGGGGHRQAALVRRPRAPGAERVAERPRPPPPSGARRPLPSGGGAFADDSDGEGDKDDLPPPERRARRGAAAAAASSGTISLLVGLARRAQQKQGGGGDGAAAAAAAGRAPPS
jgi:hypothetical protein